MLPSFGLIYFFYELTLHFLIIYASLPLLRYWYWQWYWYCYENPKLRQTFINHVPFLPGGIQINCRYLHILARKYLKYSQCRVIPVFGTLKTLDVHQRLRCRWPTKDSLYANRNGFHWAHSKDGKRRHAITWIVLGLKKRDGQSPYLIPKARYTYWSLLRCKCTPLINNPIELFLLPGVSPSFKQHSFEEKTE